LHLNPNISAPRKKFQFHCPNLMNLHAKFQPPGFNTVGGGSGDGCRKFYFSMIPIRISKHPPFACSGGIR